MLEKFEFVNKVGLFEDYSHSPGREFGEVTLIYGENGVGKSTLAAILDSLRERNASEIIRRRSLPGDVAPTAAVSVNGKLYTFNGHDWDDQLPYDTLEVFYPGFVTRNVHASIAVDPENRRNLCELVLGRKSVEKVARLAQADGEGRAALTDIKAIEKQLQLLIKQPDTLETFLGLPNDPQIDDHRETVRAELKQVQNRDAILARVLPSAVALPTIDRRAINKLLEKSSEGIGADVAGIVREHIEQHLDKDGEGWLDYGARHTGTDNKCPFCAQDLAGSSLAAAIRSYFSAEYRAYTAELSLEIERIWDHLSTATFSALREAISAQVALSAQWTDEMPIDQPAIAASLAEAKALWTTATGKLELVVARKQAKPLDRIEPAVADEALAAYEKAIAVLGKVNATLSASRKKAEECKLALSKADTAEIEQRLRRLENQKTRFEQSAQNLIEKRDALIEKRTKLEGEKSRLKKEIDEHAAKVVGKYQAGINHYLEYFGCDIRIESVEPKFPGGRASVQYTLKAHGHEIELGVSAAGPCFETVLSEGDKNTLALSFFFARLKDLSDLSGRIVVLDDPVNSLGSSRRILIEGVVRDLRLRGAQVIILTHDERLAAMVWRDKKLNKDIVSLQVERTRNGSQMLPWDVERATQSEYVEDFLILEDYLEHGGDHKRAAGCIRPYLEQRLRYLFPGPPFNTRDNFGTMIAKIRESPPKSRLYTLQAKLPELEAINEASLPSHHATNDVPGLQPLTPDEVRLFAQKALDILG
jgi:wobble nucleotide-excising tRNase